jgi:hypothetical protein
MNLVSGIDLIIRHQQRGATGIDVRKLRYGVLVAGDAMVASSFSARLRWNAS